MTTLSNSPNALTILRLEARKAFQLGLHIYDPGQHLLDLTGCELTIVAKATPVDTTSDATNLFAADAVANIPVPEAGYALFSLQAATLDVAAGEYPFSIVLKQTDGYTSVIVKGLLDVQENTEWSSVEATYDGVNPAQSLTVRRAASGTINVFVGGQLPPGMNYVRDEVMAVLEAFDPDSVASVPVGGAGGAVLTKLDGGDYVMGWRPVGNGQFALDATGQLYGAVPKALGDGTWVWEAVGIDATGVPEGQAPLSNGDGTWSWGEVTLEIPDPDWAAGVGEPGEILNKPTLGTMAAKDEADYMPVDTLVSAMPGVHIVDTIPVSGTDGHLYFVYTP